MIDESKIIVYKLYFVEKKKKFVVALLVFFVYVNFEKIQGWKIGLVFC